MSAGGSLDFGSYTPTNFANTTFNMGNPSGILNNNLSISNPYTSAFNSFSDAVSNGSNFSFGSDSTNALNQLANPTFTGQYSMPSYTLADSTGNSGSSGNGSVNNALQGYLGIGNLVLSGLAGIGSYFNGRSALKLAKQQLNQQRDQFNETFNYNLKAKNQADADRLRARAQQETGNQHSYDDEITANAYARGHAGSDSSVNNYLSYKRSSNG